MRFFLTLLLPFHWMVVFALLAIMAASGPHGFDRVAAAVGLTAGEGMAPLAGPAVSAAFAVMFALVAALFLWSLVAALTDNAFPGSADEVAGAAFGAAVGAATALLLVAAITPVDGLLGAVGLQVAALAASYAALHAERRGASLVRPVEGGDARAAARFMAAGAAHASMLTRLSGRTNEGGK